MKRGGIVKLTRDAIDVCDAPSRLIRDNRALLSVGFIDPCHVAVVRSIIAYPQIRIVMTVEMEHRYLLTQAIFTPRPPRKKSFLSSA